MNRLASKLGVLNFNNPITVASGTFSHEYNKIYDINKLGAIVTKTITPEPKNGNPTPRLFETEAGLLNSIGLQNPGIDQFLKSGIKEYSEFSSPLIISFSAGTINEFCEMLQKLESCDQINGYEVNVSCPNVENEGIAFGVNSKTVNELTSKLAKLTRKELIIKLSPNVTDIVSIAKAAVDGGATSLALINTMMGMAIDPLTGKSRIKKGIAGYSGQAIKPIALQMVYKVAKAVNIPILAMGGVYNYLDCLEFFYAGASMIAVGTSQFSQPDSPFQIIKDLEKHFSQTNQNLSDIIGKVWGIE
jgi:dihydroorotate dehydrogenase (NAD+) catalytic subunit